MNCKKRKGASYSKDCNCPNCILKKPYNAKKYCPNCHKKVQKGKIYCDDPVCKSDRATKRGLLQWSIRKQKK